jgi:hypothetical protein
MTNRRVLGVFAKWPTMGRVKTRLANSTSPTWAARIAEAFLKDTLARLAEVDAHRVIVFDPAEEALNFTTMADDRFSLCPQTSGDLGQRLSVFMMDQFQSGASAVVVVGTDSPTMPVEFVDHAFRALSTVDVVVGPAMDGGYYLLGLRKSGPIFSNIDWSSASVLAQTIALIRANKLSLSLLPPWYDVDTVEDLKVLTGHIAALRQAGFDVRTPHTEALLLEN